MIRLLVVIWLGASLLTGCTTLTQFQKQLSYEGTGSFSVDENGTVKGRLDLEGKINSLNKESK